MNLRGGMVCIMKLKDICKYRKEKIELKKIKKEQYISTDNMLSNFSGVGEIKSFPNVEKVNKYYRNDILISNIRPYFKKMIISDIESGCSSDILVIETISKDANPKFLYYRLMADDFFDYVILTSKGTKMPRGDKEAIMNFELILPNIRIQNKIVEILETIDKKIKLNNQINNNLYEEALALYKDKFKGINQDKKTIGDYIVPKRGKNLLTRDAIDGDTPIVAGGIEPSSYHNQFNTKSPVITISASGANAGYTNLWSIPVWASDCSYIDDSITKNVYFWYIVLKTRQDEIFDAQTGSAQPHIYPQHIAEMSICELNINEVEKYNNLVAPLFKMIGENQKENKKLKDLRDALLPKLMNGEINLDNIEI